MYTVFSRLCTLYSVDYVHCIQIYESLRLIIPSKLTRRCRTVIKDSRLSFLSTVYLWFVSCLKRLLNQMFYHPQILNAL